MKNRYKEILAVLICVAVLGLALACGGGSGSDSTGILGTTGTTDTADETMRLVAGEIAASSETITYKVPLDEAPPFRAEDIDTVMVIDSEGNIYTAPVTNMQFEISLPVDKSFIMAFMVSNQFVAVIVANSRNWFHLNAGVSKLNLGKIVVDLERAIAIPPNDPNEGNPENGTAPWGDDDADGIPDCLQPGCTGGGLATSPWPKYRGNTFNNGYCHKFKKLSTMGLYWIYAPENSNEYVSAPVISAQGTVIYNSAGTVFAVNPNTGLPVWSGPADFCEMAIDRKGNLYITRENIITMLNAETGAFVEQWPASATTTPTITGNRVFTIGLDGTVYMVDESGIKAHEQGTLMWAIDSGQYSFHYPPINYGIESLSTPAIDDLRQTIYFVGGGNLRSVNMKTGEVKWSFNGGGVQSQVFGSVALGPDGTVYVSGKDMNLYVVDPDTGEMLWRYNTGPDTPITSPTVGPDGTVYVGATGMYGQGGKLLAIKDSQTLTWSYNFVGHITAPVVDANGIVYIGCNNGWIYAVNSDGTLRWKIESSGAIERPIALGDGILYFADITGRLYAVTETGTATLVTGPTLVNTPWPCARGNFQRTGKSVYAAPANPAVEKWSYQANGGILSDSIIIGPDHTIYFSSAGGEGLICLEPANGNYKWHLSNPGFSHAFMSDGFMYGVGGQSVGDTIDLLKIDYNPDTGGFIASGLGRAPFLGGHELGFLSLDTIYCIYNEIRLHTILRRWVDDSAIVSNVTASAPVAATFSCSSELIGVTGDDYVLICDKGAKTIWQYQTYQLVPAIIFNSKGVGYIWTKDCCAAVDATGKELWHIDKGNARNTALDEANNRFYGCPESGTKFIAINTMDGTVAWEYDAGAACKYVSVDKNGNVLFTCADKKVYCLDKDGNLKWSYTFPAEPVTTPVITADGKLLVGCADNKLYCIGE